jgi:radical SAM-linked protein
VDEQAHSPFIPAEALARQARLAEALAGMAAQAPNREPAPLQELRRFLAAPAEGDLEAGALAIASALGSADLAEEGVDLLRSARRTGADPACVQAATAQLAPLAAKAQVRREAGWQMDSRRTCLRLAYAKEGEALDFDDGDLHALFLQALRLEGFLPALDLGKRPRPMLRVALPLPAGAGGRCEWLELTLRADPPGPADAHLARLNARLPPGLRLHGWEPHPAYASPLGELAERSHWRWSCPAPGLEAARARTEAFLAASDWPWEKGGKVEGRKQAKQLDLRPLVEALRWEGTTLFSTTRTIGAESLSPLKVHAAILGLDPAAMRGLERVSVALRPDPRLAQAERFEPKLKNMYEDAVLLAGGSNITLVDEDDDEPIRLG